MASFLKLYLMTLILTTALVTEAIAGCCDGLNGIRYCDSSAGRYVCQNGDYSTCYCTRHAIMDLQKLEGCCLWQGGVFKISDDRQVLCNNGSVSEICTIQNPAKQFATY